MSDDSKSADFQPVQRSSLSELVYKQLLEQILTNRIKQGDHLVEQTLADKLAVSRISIREAIRKLNRDGLVNIIPNRGAFVITLDDRDIEEIYHVRAAIESMAVALAIPRLTPGDAALFDSILQKMEQLEKTGDRFNGAALDVEFHRLLMHLSANNKAVQMWEQMSTQIQMIVYIVSDSYPYYHGFTERHQNFLDFFISGDTQSATAYLQAHIMEGARHLIAAKAKSA